MEAKKHSWHGPKQIGMMIYTAILFLIGTSIIGGNNNTVFPMFSEIQRMGCQCNQRSIRLSLYRKGNRCIGSGKSCKKRQGLRIFTTVTLISFCFVTDRIWNDKELTVYS